MNLIKKFVELLKTDLHLGKRSVAGLHSGDPFVVQQFLLKGLGVDRPVIFDAGAYFGQTAFKYKALMPQSTIYSFEPFPASFKELRTRFKNDENVIPVPLGLGTKVGTRRFFVNHFDQTNSLFPRSSSSRRYYPENAGTKATINISVTSIDKFMKNRKISEVDILKIDVQGGELMVLKGARRALEQKVFSLIYLEGHFVPHYEKAPLFYEVWSFLADYGYSLFNIYNLYSAASSGQLRQGDILFVSKKARSELIDQLSEEP